MTTLILNASQKKSTIKQSITTGITTTMKNAGIFSVYNIEVVEVNDHLYKTYVNSLPNKLKTSVTSFPRIEQTCNTKLNIILLTYL